MFQNLNDMEGLNTIIQKIAEPIKKNNADQDEDLSLINEKKLEKTESDSSVELFVNYDICNFTKYKNEHSNWLDLLQKFIEFATDLTEDFPSEVPFNFWKFSGDAITFRQTITSVYEIAVAIEIANKLLSCMEKELNKVNARTYSNVYIKAAIWIAEFMPAENKADNIKFRKSEFGQEFVGKNMDEGFRICTCSKADIMAVDPKIVHIFNVYAHLVEKNNDSQQMDGKSSQSTLKLKDDSDIKKDIFLENLSSLGRKWSDLIKSIREKIRTSLENDEIIMKKIVEVGNDFYFITFQHCKGVWCDREYPIFWYINQIENKVFLYDETVGEETLRKHDIYRLSSFGNAHKEAERKVLIDQFDENKSALLAVFEQVRVSYSIYSLLVKLQAKATTSNSYQIINTANLYYMVAIVVKSDSEDLGVLIFKRKAKGRKHLKNVWDLVPIKHTPTRTINSENMLKEYLESRLKLVLPYSLKFDILTDDARKSIVPVSLCNVYRNGVVHNGILCISELNINSESKESFLNDLKEKLQDNECYSDVKLVSLKEITNKNDEEYICINDLMIRSLTPQEVSEDSNRVSENPDVVSKFDELIKDEEYGISYLAISIKQILMGRKNGFYNKK